MFSEIIFHNLFNDATYLKKYSPYFKKEYFHNPTERIVYTLIDAYYRSYSKNPTYAAIKHEITKLDNINELSYNESMSFVDSIENKSIEKQDSKWLCSETEKWIKDQAVKNAIIAAAELVDKNAGTEAIPHLITEAYSITFDTHLATEFFNPNDIDTRWDLYNLRRYVYKTSISKLNYSTAGGFGPKTLNVIVASPNVGKTAALVAYAADFVSQGYDVLYVTLEMAEDKISMRFESNYLKTSINDIKDVEKESFKSRIMGLRAKSFGRLFVREYPPACANVNHIRALLDDLLLQKNFKPQIIMVDYINLMSSTRIKNDNLYTYIKSISEELRGLAVEGQYCIFTATQTTRGNFEENDIDLADISESFGLAATADFVIGFISTEELQKQGIMVWKILKNRYSGIKNYRFKVTSDFDHTTFTDLTDGQEEQQQKLPPMKNNPVADMKVRTEEVKEKMKGLKLNF